MVDDDVFQGIAEAAHDQVLADSKHERKKAVDHPTTVTVGTLDADKGDEEFVYPTDEEREHLPREPGTLNLLTFSVAVLEFAERFGYYGWCVERSFSTAMLSPNLPYPLLALRFLPSVLARQMLIIFATLSTSSAKWSSPTSSSSLCRLAPEPVQEVLMASLVRRAWASRPALVSQVSIEPLQTAPHRRQLLNPHL